MGFPPTEAIVAVAVVAGVATVGGLVVRNRNVAKWVSNWVTFKEARDRATSGEGDGSMVVHT